MLNYGQFNPWVGASDAHKVLANFALNTEYIIWFFFSSINFKRSLEIKPETRETISSLHYFIKSSSKWVNGQTVSIYLLNSCCLSIS